MALVLAIATILGGLTALVSSAVSIRRALERRRKARHGDRHAELWRPATPSAPAVPLEILDRILDDLQLAGPMRGQFGKAQVHDETQRFLQSGETVSAKPRLYLTYWPAAVLSEPDMPTFVRDRSASALALVQSSLRQSLADGGMRISMGAGHALPPNVPTHSIVSFRHTVKAAHTLYAIDGHDPVALTVLGRATAEDSDMVDDDGAWRLCDREFVDPDLWATAYGVFFIADVLSNNHFASPAGSGRRAEQCLRRSLNYLNHQLSATGWRYGEVTQGENAVLIAIEIGPATLRWRRDLATRIHRLLHRCCDDEGNLTAWYLHETRQATPPQAAVRLAYALRRMGVSLPTLPRLEAAMKETANSDLETLNSAELAMLLEMIVTS